jgi:hypothetical protein
VLIYTSPSHQDNEPKWRILAPCSQPYPPETRAKLVARLNGILKSKIAVNEIAAPESFTLSQAYYYGWVNDSPKPDHRAEVIEGDYIDLRDDLAEYEASGAEVELNGTPHNPFEQAGDRKRGLRKIIGLLESCHPDSNWHEPMLRATASMVGYGWPRDAIIGMCAAYAHDGIDDHDVEVLVDGAIKKYGQDDVVTEFEPVDLWANFDPPPLPADLLPETIERYARIEGVNMGCDPAGLAMSALTVCAAAISDTIKLRVKQHDAHYLEPARLWNVQVGDPSTKKTPGFNQSAAPLRRIDYQLTTEYVAEKEGYDELSTAEKKKRPAPKHRRLILEDTTVEAAQEVLKNSPDGVLCLQDELSGFLGNMDKYSGNKGANTDRAFWMKAYNGGPASFHRITRGEGLIPNLSVCMLGGVQPDVIPKVAADGIDDGLLQRATYTLLRPATVGQDKPRDPVVSDYFRLVEKLYRLAAPQQPGFNNNETEPTVLQFDPGAQAIRSQLEERHVELMNSESVNKKLAAHIGKYDGVFARLCVLWHCIENVDQDVLPTIVTEDTAHRVAKFLHEFLLKHAIAFFVGMLGFADDHDRLKNVASYILARKLDKISNRDICRGDRSMRKLSDGDTVKIFEQLEALGWLDRRYPTKPPQKLQWVVNPLVHTRFADRAKREKARRGSAREAVAEMFR